MARRTDLLNRITKQLAILAYEVELMNRSNRMTLNSDAETIFCGLINRLEGWDLRNLNETAQNYPGIDLADPGRRIAVQITASASQKKVDHTLEVFFKNKMERDFDRLVLVIITDRVAPAAAHGVRQGFKFDPKKDIWNIEWFKRRVESLEDCELLQNVTDYLDSQLGDLPGTVKRPDHLLPPVPGPSEFFLEGSRDAELGVLEKALEKGGPVFIWGLGGMGKTQTAIALARRCAPPRGAYFLHYTVPADPDREAMFETIRRADLTGYTLDAGDETDPDVLMEKEYREKLEILRREYADTLLIIDNFDAPGKNVETLKGERAYQDVAALVNHNVSLVFTTRYPADPAWEIRPLPEERLLELMRKSCADYEDTQMLALIRAAGGHTLMVDLMAKTLEESWQTVTPEQILEALKAAALDRADFPEVTSDKDGLFAQAQIYKHLQALFNLSGLNDGAKKVLSLAVLIAEEGLDDVLFLESLAPDEKKELQNLCKRGWLRREDHVITIHPAVVQVCRSELDRYVTGVQTFLDALWEAQEKRKCSDGMLRRVALCMTAGAEMFLDYKVYFECKKRAASLWGCVLPDDHPDLARIYSEMGGLYSMQCMFEEALGYQKKALNIKKNILPENDPALVEYLRETANACADKGDYPLAIEYGLRALAILESQLPAGHPDLASCHSSLAAHYLRAGNGARHAVHQMAALEIRERNLGPDSDELMLTYFLAGGSFERSGHYRQALVCLEKSAAILERKGSAAPVELGGRYRQMGQLWMQLEEYDMALTCMEKALTLYKQELDVSHPRVEEVHEAVVYLRSFPENGE